MRKLKIPTDRNIGYPCPYGKGPVARCGAARSDIISCHGRITTTRRKQPVNLFKKNLRSQAAIEAHTFLSKPQKTTSAAIKKPTSAPIKTASEHRLLAQDLCSKQTQHIQHIRHIQHIQHIQKQRLEQEQRLEKQRVERLEKQRLEWLEKQRLEDEEQEQRLEQKERIHAQLIHAQRIENEAQQRIHAQRLEDARLEQVRMQEEDARVMAELDFQELLAVLMGGHLEVCV